MMDLQTNVELPSKIPLISYQKHLMLFGSCFADHIGSLLTDYKFYCDVNPFGTLYNPASIEQAIRLLQTREEWAAADLLRHPSGFSYSLMHHSCFSHRDEQCCLSQINERFRKARTGLSELDVLLLTWGTAWVYRYKKTGGIVGNCHKLPSADFERCCLRVDDVVESYVALMEDLLAVNPRLKVLICVSPIRHLKETAHGNQLSKAVLLLAVEQLQQLFPQSIIYFPSYELMIDELRDYRFYAEDMVHPSSLAVKYIWSCFVKTFCSDSTLQQMQQWEKIAKALNHRPFDVQASSYYLFLEQLIIKIETFALENPMVNVEKEIELCRTQLRLFQKK